jgi:hypothetical protein
MFLAEYSYSETSLMLAKLSAMGEQEIGFRFSEMYSMFAASSPLAIPLKKTSMCVHLRGRPTDRR